MRYVGTNLLHYTRGTNGDLKPTPSPKVTKQTFYFLTVRVTIHCSIGTL